MGCLPGPADRQIRIQNSEFRIQKFPLNLSPGLLASLPGSMLADSPIISRVRALDQDDPRSDAALVAAVNDGDASAFDALYYRHRDWVVGLAFHFTRDREAALDVLQEAFLYFARKFPGAYLRGQLRSFLYPVVRNLSIDHLRKQDRFTSLEAWRETHPAAETPSTSPAPTAGEDLATALACLSEAHREVLHLRFVEGFDLAEMAAALEVPVGTVKSRLHHALRELRRHPHVKSLYKG